MANIPFLNNTSFSAAVTVATTLTVGGKVMLGSGTPVRKLELRNITGAINFGIGFNDKDGAQQGTIALNHNTNDLISASTANMRFFSGSVIGNIATLPTNQTLILTSSQNARFTSEMNANVVISRDNMFVGAGQFYIGAETSNVDNTFRQLVSSGAFKLQKRISGTFTNVLDFDSSENATFAGKVNVQGSPPITPNANFDDLVITDSGNAGISIFSGNANDGAIYFGDQNFNGAGQIKYLHATNSMTFTTDNDLPTLIFDNQYLATFAGAGTFAGNLTAASGIFNSGATNVVASFTSTDGIAGIALIDNAGSVELSASGNTFQVQPAGGAAALTVSSTTSTFGGNVIIADGNYLELGALYLQDGAAGRIGFNRDTSNGAIHDSSYNAFQLQINTSGSTGKFEIQGYNGSGGYIGSTFITGNGLIINDYITHNGDDNTFFGFSGQDVFKVTAGNSENIYVDINGANFRYQGGQRLGTTSTGIAVAGAATATTATTGTDVDATLTTKSYVDGLVTGVPVYKGTWDASGTAGGTPDLRLAANKVLGNYYIVSTLGSATPNGTGVEPDSWAVGDWCIFSDVTPGAGTDLWQRIDNSSVVSGAGTGQSVTKWEGTLGADSETLTDGPITFNGSDSTFAGNVGIGIAAQGSRKLSIQNTNADNEIEFYGTDFTNIYSRTNSGMTVEVIGNGFAKLATTGGSLIISSAGAATFTSSITFNGTLNSTGNLILSTASSGANIELYTNGQAYYDAVSHNFRDSDASPTYFQITASQVNSFVALDMNNLKITTLATPTNAADAANKAYVDAHGGGLGPFLPLSGGTMLTTAKIQFYNTAQYIQAISVNDLDIVAGDDINTRSNFNRFFSGGTEHARLSGLANQNNWIANGTNGKLGVGTTVPAVTLDVNGSTKIVGGIYSDTGGIRLLNPGGAIFTNQTPSYTGAIKITLPVGFTNTMQRMTIKVYEYGTSKSFTVNCGGYNYQTGSWINTFAYTECQSDIDINYTVRFGKNSSNIACIYIGELAETWSYPQIFVTDWQGGYSNLNGSTWDNGWDVAFEASAFESITKTIANTQVNNWGRNGQNLYWASGSGNVGIGVTSPLQKLVVQDGDGGGTGGSGIDSRTKLLINANTEAYLTFNVPALSFTGQRYMVAGTTKASVELWDYAADPQFRITSVDSRPLTFATQNAEKMRISPGGSVKFNTYDSTNNTGTPTYLLGTDASGNVVKTLTTPSPVTSQAASLYDLIPNGAFTTTYAFTSTAGTYAEVMEGNDVITAAGTYSVQMYVDDYAVGGTQYREYYSGVMSWNAPDNTNDDGLGAISEIVLHRAGHAANQGMTYLRTRESGASETNKLKLEIMCNRTYSGASNVVFKFVRLI